MLKTPAQKEVVDLCKQGNALLKQNRLREAEETFEKARALEPQNAYVLVGLGDTFRKQQRFDEAAACYRLVVDSDPENIFALRGLGDAYRGLQRFDEAISAWERYIAIKDQDYCVYTRLGDVHRKLNHFQDAERYYLKTLEINPVDKYAFLGLGNLYYKMGREDEAIRYCDRLLALDEANFINVLTMVGNIHRRRKDFDRAQGYYERALKIETRNPYALYGIGDCFRGLHKYREAIAAWSKILEDEPRNDTVLTRIGDAWLNLGEIERAREYYQRALSVADTEFARLGLGRVLRREGRVDTALEGYREMIQRGPRDLRIALEMASAYVEKGDWTAAFGILREMAREAELDFETCRRVNRVFLEALERFLVEGAAGTRGHAADLDPPLPEDDA